MSRAVLESRGDTLRVIDADVVIGEIRQIKPNDFSWESRLAMPPHRVGRCRTQAEALAHLGYKFRRESKREES